MKRRRTVSSGSSSGRMTRRAAWPVQISQGPWGANYSVPDFSPEYLSDDCFRMYAHYGINSMMIYGDLLCYTNSSILPELNHPEYRHHLTMLQDAASLAARYGVQFTYVPVGPKLRPNHQVFAEHPNAAAPNGGPCLKCSPLSTEEAPAALLDPIQQAVHTANPGAFVAAWPYSSNQWVHPDRLPFVRLIPAGIDFFLAVEKDQDYRKNGYVKRIWDYSIDFTGPSDNMLAAAEVCREMNRPLFVKSETGIG